MRSSILLTKPAIEALPATIVRTHKRGNSTRTNRMRFWIKLPTSATQHRTDGRANLNVGTYVKRVQDPDSRSDETGGDHYYHMINVPALGRWTQVILNMHPDHVPR